MKVCGCEEEGKRGGSVRQQIAVGGGAAGATVIVHFSEKWIVVIRSVIKEEQMVFLYCGLVLIWPSSTSILLHQGSRKEHVYVGSQSYRSSYPQQLDRGKLKTLLVS